ncbi:DUF3549 family protein [Vibrio sp. PP-XX7]
MVYWNERNQPWIWFLQFELDERGLLKQSDISQFIQYIGEAMGTRLNQTLTEAQQEKLANNPYTFTPPEEKMAVFHSQVRAMLGLPTSPHYAHALLYFQGELGWDQWQTVGLQGIADICTRLSQTEHRGQLLKSLAHLPKAPCYALLGILEHLALPCQCRGSFTNHGRERNPATHTRYILPLCDCSRTLRRTRCTTHSGD